MTDENLIESIPSDELIEMTAQLHRIFNAGGCNPMCHSCYQFIEIGKTFHLGTVEAIIPKNKTGNTRSIGIIEPTEFTETKEVMLCGNCTVEIFKINQKRVFEIHSEEYERRSEIHRLNGGGCFRVNGKISLK